MKKVFLILNLFFVLGVAHVIADAENGDGLKVGQSAPAWVALPGVDGKKHSLADLQSKQVVVVVFMCNSCPAVDDYVERRAPLRGQHLELARQSHERGEMVIAGALADPVDGAVLVFSTREAAEAFARNDPYVLNGLVTRWRVRNWTTVIGPGASPP